MSDFGVSGEMMDFHNFGEGDFAEFGVEYFRITQALSQAGIDVNMLNHMDKARVSAALWKDNSLFEEGGALMAMGRQSYGFMDKMHLDESEVNASQARLGDDGIADVVREYAHLQEANDSGHNGYNALSREEREDQMNGWLPSLVFGKDNPNLYAVVEVQQQSTFAHLIPQGLMGLGIASVAGMQAISFEDIKSAMPNGAQVNDKGETYWQDFVANQETDREVAPQAAAPIDADTHAGRLEQRNAREAALLEDQVGAAG